MGFDYKDPPCFFLFSLFLFILLHHTILVSSQATNNTITHGQLLRDGRTIISPGSVYELGFFSPPNSTSRYVGIWYYKVPIQTVVWVANRNNPISGNSGVFGLGSDGNLMVADGNGVVVWSTDGSLRSSSTNTTAILLDNGNLILSIGEYDIGNDSNSLWQSYDHPADTYLFDMKIYVMNALRGENHSFSAWESASDPSQGNCAMGMDPRAAPQIVTWNGSRRLWRSGHWNGSVFLGIPSFGALFPFKYSLNREPGGNLYFTFVNVNTSVTMNYRMQWNGVVEHLTWNEGEGVWNVRLQEPSTDCGRYNECGNFGICSMMDSSRCSCMDGFVPTSSDEWNQGNWSGGCARIAPLQCGANGKKSDRFQQVDRVKLPDHADSSTANAQECEDGCLRNCSCNAYSFAPGIGCMTWSGDLVDLEQFQVGGGELYIRVAHAESGGKNSMATVVAIIISVVGATCLGVLLWLLWRFRGKFKGLSRKENKPLVIEGRGSQEFSIEISAHDELLTEGKQRDGVPLPQFGFNVVQVATDNFSSKNMLGQGGFGPVYKGILPGGDEIAVKRLSKLSGQGAEEFKNELVLIAKLQHRNLVRLLGFCIEGEEKLLIYEFMRNKSLDSFLFDPVKRAQLGWKTRFEIIAGIARGLLYLHRDSRLRIIHRDLKVSNILLDEEMNPKISDFGMARIFGGNQNEANTIRVVGTYGYMSPEYAMEGLFSVKSDVYSFGVLLLEIVSGERNNSFHSEECSNLIRHAWNLWKEEKAEELIDPLILKSCNTNEALQCIHVAMLCVQISALLRPTMASVLLMLESENASLPQPTQPEVASMNSVEKYLVSQYQDTTVSSNDMTITQVSGR